MTGVFVGDAQKTNFCAEDERTKTTTKFEKDEASSKRLLYSDDSQASGFEKKACFVSVGY